MHMHSRNGRGKVCYGSGTGEIYRLLDVSEMWAVIVECGERVVQNSVWRVKE